MTTAKRRRLTLLTVGLLCLAGAVALVLSSLGDTLTFFFSPTELAAKAPPPGQRVRIGGLVEDGSVVKEKDGLTTDFKVTDLKTSIEVSYKGMLPALFRAGQGVVVEGRRQADGGLKATEVLAKHDERYMPKEVVEALKASGRWKEGKGTAQ